MYSRSQISVIRRVQHLAASALFGLAMLPTQADAAVGRSDAARSARVAYADLDLTSLDDIARLEQRVARQARRLCREINSSLVTFDTLRECERDVIEASRQEIDHAVHLATQERAQ